MKNIAIIPARCGSQGLKNKNIKLLNGNPLISYTIKAAIQSGVFHEVMVSTDSQEYADTAIKYGANVPFLRDDFLSTSNASSWDVVRSVLEKYKQPFNMVTLLQPTSPLRTYNDIINAFELFNKKSANSVISVCQSDTNPFYLNTLENDLRLNNFISKKIVNSQRQNFDIYYKINGAIYMCLTDIMDNIENELYNINSFAYIMPKERSIDIDTMLDFQIAQYLMSLEKI